MKRCIGTGFPEGEGGKINLWLKNIYSRRAVSLKSDKQQCKRHKSPSLGQAKLIKWMRTDAVPRGPKRNRELVIPSFSDQKYSSIYLHPPAPLFHKV